MSLDEELLKQLLATFREELAERLDALNAGLLSLEQETEAPQRAAMIEELFRHVHSLKGAARAVNLKAIEELTHGLEDVLGAAKRESIQLTPPLFDLLYQGLDLIGQVMAAFDAGRDIEPLDLPGYLARLATAWRSQPLLPPSLPSFSAPREREKAARPEEGEGPIGIETVRVPTTRLDDLMAQAGELLVTRLRIAQQMDELHEMERHLARWQKEWQQVRGLATQELSAGDGGNLRVFLERNEEHLRFLANWLTHHARRVADDTARLNTVADRLQEDIKRARMLPLATLLGIFRRMVRDLAREKGLEAVLEVHGADTEMDKQVLEQVKDPLMHLLRNCIDHGIEPPDERRKRGKPPSGTIRLTAERRGNAIVIEVADDGRGLDLPALREAAVLRGLLPAEAIAAASDAEISNLIFLPGLSTSHTVTAVSGRGIGLDIVRKNVETLQGHVEVVSRPGQGTTFTLSLPFTLTSTRCLLVRTGGQTFALPLAGVERLVALRLADVSRLEGQEAIRYQGRPLALVRLADILQLAEPRQALSAEEKLPAVVLASGGERIAFLVDELLGEQELVVKSLGRQLSRVRNVAGAAILGTGQVILILNIADLIQTAQQSASLPARIAPVEPPGRAERKVILIVDDSITTRTLEKNILTTAGYEVRLALDGEEALATLASGPCDLVVADIDMPRMDGFELSRRIKEDERYREIPIILVTSLDNPEDKARGIAVGADAYIVKSSFDQDVLLDTIRQLI